MDFLAETVVGLADRVRAGEVSARELVAHAFARIDAVDDSVGAFVALDQDGAMEAARAVDDVVARGGDPGSLAGIPIGVKDLEDAVGLPTTRGLAACTGLPTASTDSALVARLRSAGCIVVGKTNTPALGHKADTTNLVFGATRNPWNLERTAGGSSGGSAAAIAAGMVPLATGSDGGGSIRIPSALCGLSGMKPSLGRVPSGGAEPPDWQHLSTKGPMARSIVDVTHALDAVIGPEQTDLRSLPMPDVPWASAVADPSIPLRIAWSPTLGYATPDREVLAACQAAVERLEGLGAQVVEVDDVFDVDPVFTWLALTGTYLRRSVEALGALDDEDLDDTLREQLALTASVTAVDLAKAEDDCHRLNLRLVELFTDTRLLVTPVTAGLAPRSGMHGTIDGQENPNWVQYTYPFNCTRSPAGTVPVAVSSEGTPIGLQVVGPQHADQVVLRALAAMEAELGLPDPPRL